MNPMQRLLAGGSVGDVDIGDVDLGDPAAVADKLAEKIYADRPFTREDEVDVGGFDGVSIPAGGTRDLNIQVDNPFKPIAVVIPSWMAPGLQISNIKIAGINLVEGAAIPADIFTEVSTQNRVSYPTVQTSGRIVVSIFNNSANAVTPNIALKGKRIRGA